MYQPIQLKTKTPSVRNSINRSPLRYGLFLIALALTCFLLSPRAQAVTPAPDGGYFGGNTAEGASALFSLTTSGTNNTALGGSALFSLTTGSQNTAVGAQALKNNTASQDTAIGFQALVNNTSGGSNTATGWRALFQNRTGESNTANGYQALYKNTAGSFNTAVGIQALFSNITGVQNVAFGDYVLFSNIDGARNCALGESALFSLTTGDSNTAVGNATLINGGTVNYNTALGRRALYRTQGDQNVGLGFFAGSNLNDGGTNNIYLGNVGPDPIGSESNAIRIGQQTATTVTIPGTNPLETHLLPAHTATYIAGISGQTASGGVAVYINSDGKLGTLTSSARFKTDINPMDKTSEAILALKPVTFRYKKEIDPKGIPQFGLVAEEVEKVNPDLVVRDQEEKAYTVRYEAVNAMLLNEFLKEHRTVQNLKSTVAKQEATIAQQQTSFQSKLAEQEKQIDALTAGLQKVSAQLEMSKPAPQTVVNNQ